ncbi:MAG TPA: RluA family pseudouridine synthase [Trueperaceae bacterium]|nr:RluA family pseudouridine synthase [Trueperaceae bacterium]
MAKVEDYDVRTFDAPTGERLDVAISQELSVSRTLAKDLVSDGYVTLDGRPVGKPATKLTGSEVVSVLMPPPRPFDVEAEDLDVTVLYEDEFLAVIDKPPGIVAHPTATVRTGTVVNALLGRMPLSKERFQHPTDELYRPGIVHRLDKDTSGVMVVAKTDEAHRHLANSFKRRFTEKEYVAIAVGNVQDGVIVDAPIGRHPVKRHQMTVGGEAPRSASTLLWALRNAPGHTLVRAKPHTGRTHQIRVHLWHLGTPILGDDVYGTASGRIGRQALHARSLTLPHPRDNSPVTFVAPVRHDIVEAWLGLGGEWPDELEPPMP